MKIKHLILIALVLISSQLSFAQDNLLYKYIQPGSRMVMRFNLIKIASKVPGETFRASSLYQDMMKNDNGEIKNFLSDPSGTGIDFSTDFILTVITGEDGESTSPLLIARLGDAGKFTAQMEKMNKGEDDRIKVFGSNRLLLPKSFGPAIAWNNEVMIVTGISNGKKELNAIFTDTLDNRDMEVRMNEVAERLNNELKEKCFAALTPNTNNAFVNSPVFSKLMNESGDIRIWNSGAKPATTKEIQQLPPFVTRFLSTLQAAQGTESTSIVNFENGKIAGAIRNYISPEMGAIYQKYPQEPLPTQLVSRLPQGKILMLMMSAFNKDMSGEISKQNGMAGFIDSLKQYLKVDLSLFQKGFQNKAMMAIMEMPAKEDDNGEKKKILENLGLFIVIPVADKAAVAQLKALADRKMDSLAATEKGEKIMSVFRPAIMYNDSLCVIAHSAAMAEAYLNHSGNAPLPAWLPANQKGNMWMSLGFRDIMTMVFSMAGKPGKSKNNQTMEMLEMFDQLVITGGDYAEGSMNSQMEFRFSNPDKNVLEQLFEMANRASMQKAKAKKEMADTPEIMQDDVVTDAPKEAPPAPKKAPVKKPVSKSKTPAKTKG